MLVYRLEYFHPASGRISHCAKFDAPDDGQALALASEQSGDGPLELWCERRLVRRIEAIAAR